MTELEAAIKLESQGPDAGWIARYLDGLAGDGLLVEIGEGQRLVAEDSLPYDAASESLNRRFRLPD